MTYLMRVSVPGEKNVEPIVEVRLMAGYQLTQGLKEQREHLEKQLKMGSGTCVGVHTILLNNFWPFVARVGSQSNHPQKNTQKPI